MSSAVTSALIRALLWALLAALTCSACVTVARPASGAHQAIMAKAVYHLACSKDEIRLTPLAQGQVLIDVATGLPVTRAAYQASGCGEHADYVVDCAGSTESQVCTVAQTNDVSAAFPPGAR